VGGLFLGSSQGAGVDHIDLAECARRGVAVGNSGDVYSTDVADYAVGLLLDVLRQLSAAGRYVRRGSWPVQGDYPLGSKVRYSLFVYLAHSFSLFFLFLIVELFVGKIILLGI
jgi:lactate dehydrogenase-like 2-hydroxyacid dehydrogenase